MLDPIIFKLGLLEIEDQMPFTSSVSFSNQPPQESPVRRGVAIAGGFLYSEQEIRKMSSSLKNLKRLLSEEGSLSTVDELKLIKDSMAPLSAPRLDRIVRGLEGGLMTNLDAVDIVQQELDAIDAGMGGVGAEILRDQWSKVKILLQTFRSE
jgi:hypothetical protein